MSKRQGLPVDLTEEQIDEFGREMDAIYYETLESRGEKDRLYILRLIRIQRSMALFGRLTIYASLFLLPAWPHALAGWGTTLIVMALGVILLFSLFVHATEWLTFPVILDPDLASIKADKRQLEQVLMNLVVNARDAMPDGGEIRIETSNCILSEPLHRDRATVPDGEYAVVRVSDQGTGITPDKIAKIFEPFYTTKRTGEGTGLGLSMAYGIVKQTGGYIFVDSEPGQGSIFTLYFPTFILHETVPEVTAITTNEAPAVDSVEPQHADGVVLLVEDEAPVRAFASRALRMRGYTVLEADCAEQALETLEDSALSVDLFVTDVVMPGMDGPSWVREALKKRPDVKVVFVSGYAEDVFNETDEVIPNSVFLPKPFSLSDLTKTVHRQLH